MKPKYKKCKNPDCDYTFEVTRKDKDYCSNKCANYHYNNSIRKRNNSNKGNPFFELKLLWGAIYLTVKRKNS